MKPTVAEVFIPADIATARMTYTTVTAIYDGSNADATIALYKRLKALGPVGLVALNLFRAHKASSRAKVYRGGDSKGSWRAQAYQKKAWSLENLTKVMAQHGTNVGLVWGWGEDSRVADYRHVLYIELPTGQVSFHGPVRGEGPTYEKGWDSKRNVGATRICKWIETLFKGTP